MFDLNERKRTLQTIKDEMERMTVWGLKVSADGLSYRELESASEAISRRIRRAELGYSPNSMYNGFPK